MKAAILLVTGLAIGLAGCRHPKSPAELESGLQDPDPAVRRNAADGLRDGDDVPPEALPKLYAALDKEDNPEALGAELITVGASGAPEALPYICKYIGGGGSGDVRMSRWANHALTNWKKKNPSAAGCNGQVPVSPTPNAATPSATPGGANPAPAPTVGPGERSI